jgi:dTDP-4-amino-4,6-dideoxygalactose transaminase
LLADADVGLPRQADWAEAVWHLFVIRVTDRDGLRDHLTRTGVSTGIHYPVPIHLQPAYEDLGYRPGDFPVTERAAAEIVSLPMFAELDGRAVAHVADRVRDAILQRQPLPASE